MTIEKFEIDSIELMASNDEKLETAFSKEDEENNKTKESRLKRGLGRGLS